MIHGANETTMDGSSEKKAARKILSHGFELSLLPGYFRSFARLNLCGNGIV